MEINISLDKYIKVYEDVVPNDVLENLIKICKESNRFEKASVLDDKGKHFLENKIRNTFSWSMQNIGVKSLTEVHWTNFLYNVFSKSIEKYLESLNINECCSINDIQILKYNVGGHYKFHVDDGATIPRTFSCIFFLNEDYEGGDLLFKFPGDYREYKINRKKNSVVVWPSNFLYPHSVTPVTKGERYSVVSWAR